MTHPHASEVATEILAALDEVIRAAVVVGRSQVYSDENPERLSWLRYDENELEHARFALMRALEEK